MLTTPTAPVGSLLPALLTSLELLAGAGPAARTAAQEMDRCADANRFLTTRMAMVTRIDADTLDDWRTHQRLEACRITAAGMRRTALRAAARRFYDELRTAGWSRTPNPHDAPNESSLRMRLDQTDCLFNVYQGILLGTEAEIEVTGALETRPGDESYHVVVICIAALDAPRPAGATGPHHP